MPGGVDTLQFVRFARQARERVEPALLSLLSRCDHLDGVVPKGSPLPPHDFQALLLSLPHLLGIEGDSLGAGGPSLTADRLLGAAEHGQRRVVCLRSGLRPSLRHTTRTVPQLSHKHWYKNRGGASGTGRHLLRRPAEPAAV